MPLPGKQKICDGLIRASVINCCFYTPRLASDSSNTECGHTTVTYRTVIYRLLLLFFVLSAQGCSTLGYYSQAVGGHLDILSRREALEDILDDPARDPELKQRLRLASRLRTFASDSLKLPDNNSYRSYVALDRPYAVWVVFATEAFSLTPKSWCYPILGCVAYRGYYDEGAAREFAHTLEQQGYDVYVGASVAYSTLGWFDDPLLSTMYQRGEIGLAGLIFHELAHQQLYVDEDTAFNEAFATVVEEAGVRRWLGEGEQAQVYAAYQRRKLDFLQLLRQTREALQVIYHASDDVQSKRQAKQAVYARLRQDYQGLKRRWQGYAGYDAWFEGPLNNAKLASVAVYRDKVPVIERWLHACDEDFARFYEAMAALKSLTPAQRSARLNEPGVCRP